MTSAYQQILRVLQGCLSALNAEGVLVRALREANIRPEALTLDDLPGIIPHIERRARLYIDAARLVRLRVDLEALAGSRPSRRSKLIPIRIEADISSARIAAKVLCDDAGARSYVSHKIATIVSELARNIVHYTPGGAIEVTIRQGVPTRFLVIATDDGAGIPNLSEILAGRYRSKTGLGRGLIGVKRLGDRCQIDTGPNGTRIEIEVHQ